MVNVPAVYVNDAVAELIINPPDAVIVPDVKFIAAEALTVNVVHEIAPTPKVINPPE